jgi:homocysteine S-methyltransferase
MTGATVLPQLVHGPYLTDGGLETTIVFHQGIDLVDFAAFTLLDTHDGRAALRAYYEPYLVLAEAVGSGIVLDTPTWRASADWGVRQGYDARAMIDVNQRAVDFVRDLAGEHPTVDAVLDGVVGPRGDGYVVEHRMTAAEAAGYHAPQLAAFAAAGAAMATAVTMTYAEEATGIARAAGDAGLPVVVSFTVETDGRLPSGQPLGEAIDQVDDRTGGSVAYFMVNCAHPSHFDHVLRSDQPWLGRVQGVRANASARSHAELDEATELDRGDIADLAARYIGLDQVLGGLAVVGGCCGTDHEHVAAMAAAVVGRTTVR